MFEAGSPGGKAAELRAAGFRFDLGPTILTLPDVLRRVFAEAGRDLGDYLTLVERDPQWRCFFDDGSTLDLTADMGTMVERLERNAPVAGDGYRRFVMVAEQFHRISEDYYFWRPAGSVGDMLRPRSGHTPRVVIDFLKMRLDRTVSGTVRACVTDTRVAQMLDHFTQYVGSCPEASPAALCGIAQMQTAGGVWYPLGGTRAVAESLLRLAAELGVEVRTNTAVRQILTEAGGQRVRGVETENGEVVELAAVVSTADSVRTHRELLAESAPRAAARFARRRNYEPACSGVVLFHGLSQAYDHLLHHGFVFSRDPHEEFAAIYDRGEPAPDPTCYVCAPAHTEPGVAPTGGEALYVLVHTPYLRPHHDWKAMLPAYRRVILDELKTTGGMPDLEERIVTTDVARRVPAE